MHAFTFGRFNPLTKGHVQHIATIVQYAKAKNIPHTIYVSGTVDKDNPLTVNDKIALIKSAVPDAVVKQATNMFDVLRYTDDDVIYFAGSDYKSTAMIDNFHKHATPNSVVVFTGKRMDGVSGTAARLAAQKGDFETFRSVLADVPDSIAQQAFSQCGSGTNSPA